MSSPTKKVSEAGQEMLDKVRALFPGNLCHTQKSQCDQTVSGKQKKGIWIFAFVQVREQLVIFQTTQLSSDAIRCRALTQLCLKLYAPPIATF